jgi:hypothetical protein
MIACLSVWHLLAREFQKIDGAYCSEVKNNQYMNIHLVASQAVTNFLTHYSVACRAICMPCMSALL